MKNDLYDYNYEQLQDLIDKAIRLKCFHAAKMYSSVQVFILNKQMMEGFKQNDQN